MTCNGFMPGALERIRILDFSHALAGSLLHLAPVGLRCADVCKLESCQMGMSPRPGASVRWRNSSVFLG